MELRFSNFLGIHSERESLKLLLFFSFVAHLFFLLGGHRLFVGGPSSSVEDKWEEIEADLSFDVSGEAKLDSIDQAVKGEELKVQKQVLPQLTKTYEVEEAPAKDVADEGEVVDTAELEREKRERLAAVKLKKKEALRRLLKEKARQEKKFAEQTTSPILGKLEARKRELETGGLTLSMKVKGFLKKVKSSVQRNYSIPEIYRRSNREMIASFVLVLDKDGQIKTLKLSKSSGETGFDSLGKETIRKSAPLPRPPKELVGKEFVLNFDLK